jgi:PEGA domain
LAAAGLGFFGFKVFERFSPGLTGQGTATGALSISSSPPGASVHWQGHEIGKTPLTNYTLPAGDQVIELQMPNYLTRPIEFRHFVLSRFATGKRDSRRLPRITQRHVSREK